MPQIGMQHTSATTVICYVLKQGIFLSKVFFFFFIKLLLLYFMLLFQEHYCLIQLTGKGQLHKQC